MKRPFVLYPLLLFVLGAVLKLTVLVYGLQHQGLDLIARMALPLFLLLSVFLGVQYERREEQGSFFENSKLGLKSGMIFTLCITLFSGLYYGALDPEYYSERNEDLVQGLEEEKERAKTDEDVQDPLPDVTLEEYRKDLQGMTSAYWIMTLNLAFFTFLSLLAALLIAFLRRTLLRNAYS